MKRKILLCSTIAAALVCGCVSVSKSDSLEVNRNDLAISIESAKNGKTNFRIRSIVRNLDSTEQVDVDGHGHKQLQRLKTHEADWPALRDAIAKRMDNPAERFFDPFAIDEQPLAPHRETVPVDIVVDETFVEDVETPTKDWTTLLNAFSVGVFPAIWTSESECHLSISFPASSCSGSGQVRRNTWISWFTLPWLFVPEDRETPVAEALSEVIVSKLTPERYRQNLEFLEAERLAAEKRAEEERIAAEKRAEEERIAAEKRAEEERIATEKRAQEARLEEERRRKKEEERIAWLNNLSNKFPLRERFPNAVSVYKEFHTGCSLVWTRRYMEQEGFRLIKDQPRFLRLTGGLDVSERPVQKTTSSGGTEASCFVWNPVNITFSDENRIVTLTFGDVLNESGLSKTVLVGGELFFKDGSIPDSALVGKYQKAEPFATTKTSVENGSDFGVRARLRLTEIRSDNAVIKICNVLDAESKEEHSESASESAVEKAFDRDANLYDASVSAATIAFAMGVDALVAVNRDERRLENLNYWRGCRNKPVVSILDTTLFEAMAEAKDAENKRVEAIRREREAAEEKAKQQELKRKLDSF